MNIRDLSIGDWVFHDDIVFGREFGKVNRLSKKQQNETIGITVYRSDGAFGVVGYILTSITDNDIQPIPITAEALEKNGFVKNGEWCVEYADFLGTDFSFHSVEVIDAIFAMLTKLKENGVI